MNDPLTPTNAKVKRLTAERLQDSIDHAVENPALPHEEAADPYYEAYLCDQIKMMAEDMTFPEQWAAEIGVTEMRMFGWIERYPEFAEAYAVAVTKLRAAFTAELMQAARGKKEGAIGPLYAMIAKKRFADLFGDAPPPPAGGLPAPRDITPTGGQVIDGQFEEMESDQLRQELEALRKRHDVE